MPFSSDEIFLIVLREPGGADGRLHAFQWLASEAIAECPAKQRRSLEAELMVMAAELGLIRAPVARKEIRTGRMGGANSITRAPLPPA